jgi:anthranilate synthase component 1
VARLSVPATLPPVDIAPLGDVVEDTTSTFTHEGFIGAIHKAKEYIQAGDIFQVVLSQRLEARTNLGPFPIYRALRVVNPSPFLFLLRQGPLSLVGSSPEIMVRVDEGEVTIRPLAGTRRRGRDAAEDDALAAELLADPKERAEHIMLVDLGRNDVGRVASFGSVRIRDVLTVERYSHVMHLCSTVTGQVRPELTALEALRACLPAGTLSGAPKVRAMQIIDELEPVKRGPYGGAVGYIDFSGNMDTCIALRTLVLKDGVAHVQAGAGVVADSDPESEWQETLNKARGLLRALQLARGLA